MKGLLPGRISVSDTERQRHGHDESYHPPTPPDAVVYPTSTEEVAQIVRICATHRLAIIPFGVGSSLEGHVAAVNGGVCIDLSEMNGILSVRHDDLDATVQAGVTRQQLNAALQPEGFFFPVDPGADATLGGMAATRASGTTTVRYGSMRDNVLSLVAVLADGRVIRTARRARKSSAGYDLTRLLIGSEGTLGVITELTVRIYGTPEAISAAVCPFPTVEAAVTTVIRTIQFGVPIARAEFLDDVAIDAVNRHHGLAHAVRPTLFLELHGSPASVREQMDTVAEIAAGQGAGEFRTATSEHDRNQLWRARHHALYAGLALRPGSRGLVTDVCVPISQLAACIAETKADLARSSLPAVIVGHVGDGNFHTLLLVDPDEPAEITQAQALNDRMVERALRMDGTCTGEHGIGLGKRHYLWTEHGEGVDVMRAIKTALDPHNLLNPGKVVSPPAANADMPHSAHGDAP
ncbi:MAG: FAD-linked oxidase C-terminal domain-containing protein [Actinomycetota bacterium]